MPVTDINPFKVPFDEAIAYLRAKVPLPTEQWDELSGEYSDVAFAVAGITSADILNDLNEALIRAEEQGQTFQDFQRDVQSSLKAYDAPTSLSASRLALIYSQNLDNAYGAGRHEQMNDPAIVQSRPYRRWVHVEGQQHPRPAHAHMGGKVFRHDDPIAQSVFPLGFQCKCKWLTLSDDDLKERGLSVSKPIQETVAVKDRITGKIYKLPAARVDGELHPIVEPGFQGRQGRRSTADQKAMLLKGLDGLPVGLRKLALEMISLADFGERARDSRGRFTKTGSARIDGPRPDIKDLEREEFEYRYRAYKRDGSYKHMILRSGDGWGSSYDKIKEAKGLDAAENAFKESVLKLAKNAAKSKLKQFDIEEERKRLSSGTPKEKKELTAFMRLHSDESNSQTLEEWKSINPEKAKTLIARHREELRLDKELGYDEILTRGRKLTADLASKLDGAIGKEERISVMTEFRSQLIENGMPRQSAIKIVDSKQFDSSVDGQSGARRVVAESAAEFLQLTNGVGEKTLDKFVYSKPRAYASASDRVVNIGISPTPDIVFHEMGHHLEYSDRRIQVAASEFRDRRATGEPQKLNDIIGYGLYDDGEMAKPGKYISPYVGKVYSHGSTEVMSMGLEQFASARSMIDFYGKDRQHFELIIGVIRA